MSIYFYSNLCTIVCQFTLNLRRYYSSAFLGFLSLFPSLRPSSYFSLVLPWVFSRFFLSYALLRTFHWSSLGFFTLFPFLRPSSYFALDCLGFFHAFSFPTPFLIFYLILHLSHYFSKHCCTPVSQVLTCTQVLSILIKFQINTKQITQIKFQIKFQIKLRFIPYLLICHVFRNLSLWKSCYHHPQIQPLD